MKQYITKALLPGLRPPNNFERTGWPACRLSTGMSSDWLTGYRTTELGDKYLLYSLRPWGTRLCDFYCIGRSPSVAFDGSANSSR